MRPLPAIRLLLFLVASPFFLLTGNSAFADTISFHLVSTQISASTGSTVIFNGSVTNHSGAPLTASDFFFNFFGFDPNALSIAQAFDVASHFPIPNGATSPVVALFDVTLASHISGSSFPIGVVLQDVNSDSSAVQSVTVSISRGGTPTPEPAPFFLLALGLFVVLALRRKPQVFTF